jgi:hypothetical protein
MDTPRSQKGVLLAAWLVVLLTSLLPTVILQEVFGLAVSPDLKALLSLGVILLASLATVLWRGLRGLRPVLLMFLVLVGGQWLVYTRIDELPFYHAWLGNSSFNVYMLAEQSLNLLVSLLMIGALLLMGKRPRDFFLAMGDTAAPVEPIRWLGVKQGTRWSSFGWWLTLFISLGTLAFLVIAGRPSLDVLARMLPFLPAVLLAAACNAFTEEVSYKASFLSVLEGPVGPRQALLMVAAYFGLGHYYGVPYGVAGVLMAALMGWLLAKSMQETRGLFWAWFIHFWQDVWIFSFLAIGSILAGGG